ncbi:radical SAM protein [Treponema sp. R80B11-R83G3]
MDDFDQLRLLKNALKDKPFLPYSKLSIEGVEYPKDHKNLLSLLKQIKQNPNWVDEIKNASEENKYFFNMVEQIYDDPYLILNIPRISKNIVLNPPIYPSILEFHLGNACQFNCKFCFSRGELKKKNMYPKYGQYQPLDKFSIMRCINEVKELGCNRVYFSGGLEIFKSDIITDIIRDIDNDIKIYVYTNGEAIKEEYMDVLLAKLERIRFSLHAFKGETFKNVQCPLYNSDTAKKMFDTVKDNIKKLLIKRSNKNKIKIGLSFLLMPENKDEIFQFIEYWQDQGIDFIDIAKNVLEDSKSTESILDVNEWEYLVKNISEKKYKNHNGEELLGPNRYKIQTKMKKSKVCYAFLKKIVIDPYGDVWTCCLQAHPGYQRHNLYLGNIKEESILHIIQKWERIFTPGDKMIEIEHCADCTDWEFNFNVVMSKIIDDQKNGFEIFDHYFLPDDTEKRTIDKIIANSIGISSKDPRF